ncbi:phosphate ABC transporter substrate-binding protein PstS [Cellulomonas sp. WB94]|uniref:phosphate ABC transporter substrate-binding protein PstS n=1 Tax=Cellulomonas sp. WB94 TaxID=2173174 RepID=UPI000D587702|nr:phosphate ABC transporter substrate-binding protein PstS [Cellulomonas sp. WB94]PVU83314.1 phosphate ABC transporter substrate-binding protein PstS [Cellulomonas sp. WB94]
MKVRQFARLASLAGVVLVSSLTLAACGSDNNAVAGESSAAPTAGTATSAAAAPAVDCGTGGTINAEGSSAQKNAIEQAIASFADVCPDITVNYNPTGSGAGITQFTAAQVDFAGSDSALNADKGEVAAAAARCAANPAWNLPMVTGPIAVAYNLAGVDKLVLNAEVTAKIFRGEIATWNDPAIAALNTGVTLPSDAIHVFFRSDESGTTDNFTKYLKAASNGAWTDEHAKAWPKSGAGEGREKSAGVAEGVKTTPGGISYVEWSYAKDNKLGIAQIDNGSGAVELNAESVGKAVASAKAAGEGNDLQLKLDYATTEAGAYPIILVTYEIVCSKGLDANLTTGVKAFLTHFASADVQKSLVDIGYAPLPAEVQANVEKAIAAIA